MEDASTWQFESVQGITIPTRDKDAALRWYEKHLGAIIDWEYVSGSEYPDEPAIFSLPGLEVVFGVSQRLDDYRLRINDEKDRTSYPVFDFVVRDPWAWHFRLKNNGVAVSQLIEGEDADASFMFSDLDGNRFSMSNSGRGGPLKLEESRARDYYHKQFWARTKDRSIYDPYEGSEEPSHNARLSDS